MMEKTKTRKKIFYLIGKRIIDLIGSLSGLFFLFIVFIPIAACIKIESPGPVFFIQTRAGQYGKHFKFVKFRTMKMNAHSSQWELNNFNETEGLTFKISGDPRVTKFGSFLRKTSLDEIPQFWNVLLGQMSLVGPRPPLVTEVERYDNLQKIRMTVPQGMTGLWQVSGRSNLKFDRMRDLDCFYALHANLKLDLKILVATLPAVAKGRGAY